MDYDKIFNTSGKIPTDSDFWFKDIEFGSENGITPFFKRVIGEQVYHPVKTASIKFYEKFAGRPLPAGSAWTERITKKTIAKKFKPKADASDDLSFYDNGGYEWHFGLNVEGWKPVTLPSELASLEDNLKPENVGTFNNLLVNQVMMDYQRDMEAAIGKKLISTCASEKTISYGNASELVTAINDIVIEMMGTKVHYNDVGNDPNGEAINDNIYTNSEKVLVFIDAKLLNWIKGQKGSLPSPENVVIEGAEIIPMADGLPTPITAAEFAAGVIAQGWDADEEPAAMGKAQPDIFICSAARCEYRPLVGSYRVNLTKNGAGDFTNEHLIWKGGIAIRPWENALRVYSSYDESGQHVTIVNTEDNPVPTQEVSPRDLCDLIYGIVPEGAGSITGPDKAVIGSTVTLSVTPAAGYVFKEWDSTVEIDEDNKFVVPLVSELVINARFEEARGGTVTYVVTPEGAGNVQASTHPHIGDQVVPLLVPEDGYYAVGITSSDVEIVDNKYFIAGTEDVTITCTFTDVAPSSVNLSTQITPAEAASEAEVEIPATGKIGGFIHVAADPGPLEDSGLLFSEWLINGESAGSQYDADILIPHYATEPVTITAAYSEAHPLEYALSTDPTEFFVVAESITPGQTGTLPGSYWVPTGYEFDYWESVDGSITFESIYTEDVMITAGEVPASGRYQVILHVKPEEP